MNVPYSSAGSERGEALSVRPLAVEDFGALFDLVSAVAAEEKWIGAESPLDRDVTFRRWTSELNDSALACFVAESEGHLVGEAKVQLRAGLADMGMQVSATHRGRGVGSALLEAVISWARTQGAHKITLQVWPHNYPAMRLSGTPFSWASSSTKRVSAHDSPTRNSRTNIPRRLPIRDDTHARSAARSAPIGHSVRVANGEGVGAILGLHHVKIPVSDLRASREWYERVFGLEALTEFRDDEDGVVRGVVYHSKGDLVLSLRENRAAAKGVAGFDPFAIMLRGRDDIDFWADRLDSLGVNHSPIIEAPIGSIMTFDDPDGLQLRFYTLDDRGADLEGRVRAVGS
jgi:GNAT superfamily N-acetyltransferase/catechol 2,3-dioxygenase-like lactoylglutathione lyase family enzyme